MSAARSTHELSLGVLTYDCFSRLCVEDRFFGVPVFPLGLSRSDPHCGIAPAGCAAHLGEAYVHCDQGRTRPRMDRSTCQPDPHISASGRERTRLLRSATASPGTAC